MPIYEGALFLTNKIRERFALFLILNLADYCTTACIILSGGIEVMPVARGFLDLYGLTGLFFHKLFIAAGVGYLCRNMSDKMWHILNWLFTLIISWNSVQLAIMLLE